MTNSTNTTLQPQVGTVGFIIAPFALITIFVNILFFIVGLKTLKKNAHNMFVISMFGGNALHGLSLFTLAFVNKIHNDSFSWLCLSQITVYFLSVSTTLTVALLICVERLVTIKMNNYGSLMKSDGWKKSMAVIFLIFNTGYVIICIIVVPTRTNHTMKCSLTFHYDAYHYSVIMSLLSGLFGCLILSIIVMYITIVCILFNVFSQERKIAPQPTKTVRIDCKPNTCQETGRPKSTSDDDIDSLEMSKAHCSNIVEHNEVTTYDDDRETNGQLDREGSTLSSQADKVTIRNKATHRKSYRKDTPRPVSIVTMELIHLHLNERSTDTFANTQRSSLKEPQLSAWRKWELRALATSGYIIGSTLLLYGPFMICILFDALSIQFPKTIGYMSALLLALHCILNPFIYAFRFPNLRQGMKNYVCCKCSDINNDTAVHTINL